MEIDIEEHLLIISEKEKDEKAAVKSFKLLYDTFNAFLYNVIYKNIFSLSYAREIAESIKNDVFLKVYDDPLSWSYRPNQHKTQSGGFKAYISTIAGNLLKQQLRKNKKSMEELILDGAPNMFSKKWTDEEFSEIDNALSKNVHIINEVLLSFKLRDRQIIQTHFLLQEDGSYTPREILDEMADEFHTSKGNIRQIISRAKKKIKELASNKIVLRQ